MNTTLTRTGTTTIADAAAAIPHHDKTIISTRVAARTRRRTPLLLIIAAAIARGPAADGRHPGASRHLPRSDSRGRQDFDAGRVRVPGGTVLVPTARGRGYSSTTNDHALSAKAIPGAGYEWQRRRGGRVRPGRGSLLPDPVLPVRNRAYPDSGVSAAEPVPVPGLTVPHAARPPRRPGSPC
jgi:hypothetical protein